MIPLEEEKPCVYLRGFMGPPKKNNSHKHLTFKIYPIKAQEWKSLEIVSRLCP